MEEKVLLVAHRGYRQKFPENTMLGFREALKLDIDGIETDVHMTNDYNIVICHDATLDRTTDMHGHIGDRSLAEVKKADAGIKFGEQFKGERVPELRELLELLVERKDIKLLLELKDYPEEFGDFAYVSCEKTLSLCKEYGIWGADRLTIVTFSAGLCAWIKNHHRNEDIKIHGFYPKKKMGGFEIVDPYPYIDEVCLFSDKNGSSSSKVIDPRYEWAGESLNSLLVGKSVFEDFKIMGIKPCVYYPFNQDEELYKKAFEYGAKAFTCDDPYEGGIVLDKIGARKLKK